MTHLGRSVLVAVAMFASAFVHGEELFGRCVAVSDGDTITILTIDKRQVRIRLAGIDAPEKNQPFGQQAKQALSALVYGTDVKVRAQSTDRYGRTIGTVYTGGQDACLAMIQQGMAWHYTRYASTQPGNEALRYNLEARKAMVARIGLWRDPSPLPPWEWRRMRKQGEAE